jgi:tRNA(Arg) A34 adenosine deaminase TadA
MMTDKDFLNRAVKLAEEGIAKGGGPFGAVVVRNKEIISEATNMILLHMRKYLQSVRHQKFWLLTV